MKRIILFTIALLVGIVSLPQEAKATCSTNGFFDFYPGYDGDYPLSANVNPYGWPRKYGRTVEDFEMYANNVLISDATSNYNWWFRTTSGALYSKWIISPSYHRGWVSSPVFRTVFRSGGEFNPGNHRERRFVDQTTEARFYVATKQATAEAYRGTHLFARYNSEDDYYVASLRTNGDVLVQKQTHLWGNGEALGCPYTNFGTVRLKSSNGTRLAAGTDAPTAWYKLTFQVTGGAGSAVQMRFWINDVEQFDSTLTDNSSGKITYGTGGIRTDYVDVWLDDVKFY